MDELKNCRILILEDEAHIARLLAKMLQNFGCKVVGPVKDLPAALRAINENTLDAAILDVKVGGINTREVADELIRRGTPLAFASGNQSSATLKKYAPTLMITKPYAAENIYEVLCELIQPGTP